MTVPYVEGGLHPRVLPAIAAQGYAVDPVQMIDDRFYAALLRRGLTSGEDFYVVEQDVESRPGFLDDLDRCPEPWCYFAYDFSVPYEESCYGPDGQTGLIPDWFAPLGHARFSAGIGTRIADLLNSEEFLSHWLSRDYLICKAFRKLGRFPHRHRGKAIHWHDYGV